MTMTINIQELINKLCEVNPFEESEIIDQIVSAQSDAVEPLIEILNGNQKEQSWLAAKMLTRINDDRVVPALISSLPHLSPGVQNMVVELLGKQRDKRRGSSID